MARLGPLFDTQNRPKKVYVGPLFSFPGNEARKLFSGGRKWGALGGGKKFMLKNLFGEGSPAPE